MKRFILPIILLLIFILRIPSFFEPYWYGDEGIYLAIGQAMQRGAVLYRDIWDNKPPLLYFIYALSPTLIWAKLTATLCVLGTVALIFKISKSYPASLLGGFLLSLPYPLLEGTIANAELYFILPTTLAALYFWRNKINPFVIGTLLAIAALIKIPAAFDFVGMFLAYLVISKKIKPLLLSSLPLLVLSVLTVVYFYFNNALGDFLTASFGQNASYVAVGSGAFSKLSNPLFIKAFILFIASLLLLILFVKKRISKELLFLTFWFGFSLYGALLSNRPYPHYLLQIVPPFILLLTFLFQNFRKNFLFLALILSLTYYVLRSFYSGGISLAPFNYYANFFDYISEKKTFAEYANYFDSRTYNNYELADYLAARTQPLDTIFVWGDNAFIYVLSNRPSATKFIQAHHLTTIPVKNYDLVMEKLNQTKPKFIIVSKPEHFKFPALDAFIQKNYHFDRAFQDLFVYSALHYD